MENITPNAFAVCTIVASNYLSRALVLHDSLKAHHPEMDFWLLQIDDVQWGALAQGAIDRRGIHAFQPDQIQLSAAEIANFRFAYDITEVSTAYKPWLMAEVIRQTGLDVFYLDPDIQFFAPMTGLVEAVRSHELVLTPHVLHPMKRDGNQPSEADIMGSGIYNLGFLGMNRNAGRVTDWWSARLKRECYSAPAEQRFTDQRWMDFAPSFFDCFISKDETYNVAYWNVDERPIELKDGYAIRGRPLSFFHFSGFSEKTPHLLTRHHAGQPRVLFSQHPVLLTLTAGYSQAVTAAEREAAHAGADYRFNYFPEGGRIDRSFRRIFLRELVKAEQNGCPPPPSPFGPEGERPFVRWLMEPLSTSSSYPHVPRIALLLRETRPDLVAAFPDPTGTDARLLVRWLANDGAQQFSLPARLIPEPLKTTVPESNGKTLLPGLEIVGYLTTESGVGQAARLLVNGLEDSAIPYGTHVDTAAPHRQNNPFQTVGTHALPPGHAFETCVMCVNADAVAAARRRLGHQHLRNRRVVGLWFWEVETFPEHLHASFREVNEVWVATEFIRKILSPISPVPVHKIPLPIGIAEPAEPLDRQALGIPEGFFFLFSFDFRSVFRRKNPLGLIEAFTQAFQEGEGPALVVKCINGSAHIGDLEQLRLAAQHRKDIIILSDYMDAAVHQALMAACHCYVSLHRSEGLGLTMAEAMTHQKPVIATAYSGNMDFMNERNSYLCAFDMVRVGSDAPPYAPSAVWAEPNLRHAADLMRHVYDHPAEAAERGRLAATDLAERFSPKCCAEAVELRRLAWQKMKETENGNAVAAPPVPVTFSQPVKTLRKCRKRPFDATRAVPSLGSMLFQGPRRILQKMLTRVESHHNTFDEAVVTAASEHDKRLSALERSLVELRKENEIPPSRKSST